MLEQTIVVFIASFTAFNVLLFWRNVKVMNDVVKVRSEADHFLSIIEFRESSRKN